MSPCGRRPFLGENWGGCPLTPDVLGRRRPLLSRVLGAAPGPFTVALSTRIRFTCRPAAPAGNRPLLVGAQGGRGAGGDAGDRGDHPAGGGVGRWQGRVDLLCAGPRPGQLGPAAAGGPDLSDDDPLAAGHGRAAGRVGRDPGGDGGHQRLLEGGLCYLLEAHGFEVWLVNARDVKHLPGRPKTDTLDAVWLCKLAERHMLRPSFVPPPVIRQLRDVARYRVDLVAARTAEKQRVEQAAGWTPRSSSRW